MNIKFLLLTLILVIAAGSTTWLTVNLVKENSISHLAKKANPDSFVRNITVTKTSQTGEISSIMHSPLLEHYQIQDSAKFVKPNIILYREQEKPWYITADQGTSQNGSKVVKLSNRVKLHQAAGKNNKELTVTTSEATIYLQKKYAITDKPVKMTSPGTKITATGAKADFLNKIVKLDSNVNQIDTDGKTKSTLLSNQATFNEKTHLGTYLGNVRYTKATTKLNCAKLTIHNSNENSKAYKIVAYGKPVHYSTIPEGKKKRVFAQAKVIEYFPNQHLAKLIDKAKVSQKESQFNGQVITYNEAKQTVAVTPANKDRITIKFQP